MDVSANFMSDAYQVFHLSEMYIFNKCSQIYIQPNMWMEIQSVCYGSSCTRDIFNSIGDSFATKNDVCDVVDDMPDLVQHLTNQIQ